MMHNGVREYLLKPIEREKICDILARLNQEIEEGMEQEKTRQKLGQQQIRHLMLLAEMPEEELLQEANKWELSHGGLSGRSAQQFIDYLLGK